MSKRAVYRVSVAGQDISSRIDPLLTSIRVTDREGTHSDTAEIIIDDKDARVLLPRTGDEIEIALGWSGGGISVVFSGKVDEVESSGSRGGGRELRISAKGLDTQGKGKEAQQLNIDDATVEEALRKAGQAAGFTDIKVDPELAKIRRDWWGLNDESFIHFGERVAREVGGVFKVQGNRAILAKKGGGSVTGQEMPSVTAMWGDNLLAWRIKPDMGRPRHKKARARWYDPAEAKWKTKEVEIDGEDEVDTTLGDRFSRADEIEADGSATNGKADTEDGKGGGSVEMDGTAMARPGGTLILVGARPGIDGSYRIASVDHTYTRSSGWTTSVELKRPGEGVGKDSRGKKGSGGSGGGGDFALPRDPELG